MGNLNLERMVTQADSAHCMAMQLSGTGAGEIEDVAEALWMAVSLVVFTAEKGEHPKLYLFSVLKWSQKLAHTVNLHDPDNVDRKEIQELAHDVQHHARELMGRRK